MASDYVGDTEDIATRIMYELLGRRWVWPALETTEYVQLVPGQRTITLQGRPVINVDSVTVEGTTTELAHTLESKYRIRLNIAPHHARVQWCGNTPRVIVRYTYGSPPPLEVGYAIEVLAAELTKMMEDSDDCRLPRRVSTIQREGISMTMLDPQDFLDEGRTGIEEIDAALARFNPAHAKRPARVYGRMSQPSTRTNTAVRS